MSGVRYVESGWLAESIKRSRRDSQRRFLPSELERMGVSIAAPIPSNEAADLYQNFDAHFLAWTGKTLAEWKLDQ